MEFSKAHLQIIDNLQLALRKCEIPGAKGEEMLALAQGYHFLTHIRQAAEAQIKDQLARATASQSIASAQPLALSLESPITSEQEEPKKSKSRKPKNEG